MNRMKYDFHIHSKYSADGFVSPQDIVRAASKAGLTGIAVTDHNTIKGALEAKKYAGKELEIIVGSEILTNKGEVIGLFLTEDINSFNFEDVVKDIKSQNGAVILPHPFDSVRNTSIHPDSELSQFVDRVEVFNSRCVRSSFNYKARSYAEENHLNMIAGSDAHFTNEIGNAGVETESDDIVDAVFNGDFSIFGKRSNILNPVTTKLIKMWRRA